MALASLLLVLFLSWIFISPPVYSFWPGGKCLVVLQALTNNIIKSHIYKRLPIFSSMLVFVRSCLPVVPALRPHLFSCWPAAQARPLIPAACWHHAPYRLAF